jgi:hypothetical protein
MGRSHTTSRGERAECGPFAHDVAYRVLHAESRRKSVANKVPSWPKAIADGSRP